MSYLLSIARRRTLKPGVVRLPNTRWRNSTTRGRNPSNEFIVKSSAASAPRLAKKLSQGYKFHKVKAKGAQPEITFHAPT